MLEFLSVYKKTNYRGGYLRKDSIPLSVDNTNLVSKDFLAPRKIDSRDLCLSSSNQGNTPHCAGFSTAGFIEVQNWKKLHFPQQVNGDKIYERAKELDKEPVDGTTLNYAAQAAIELGFIKGNLKFVNPSRNDVKFAMHQYSVCVVGFNITDEWNSVSSKTGQISKNANPQFIGGHAVLLCGYDSNGVYIQNSWGTDWGLYGFAWLSWEQFDKQIMSGIIIEN